MTDSTWIDVVGNRKCNAQVTVDSSSNIGSITI